MIYLFHKFLDNQISLSEFEQIIYKNTSLEDQIGKDNYFFFLEINYNKKNVDLEIRNFILKHMIKEKDFGLWKYKSLMESNDIFFPDENLYRYAKENPEFLQGKMIKFRKLSSYVEIEIEWTNKVRQFVRHTSEFTEDNQKYLYLGTYENGYLHLIVNRENEIYLGYSVINEEVYWAKNIQEAIIKLILNPVSW